MNKLYPVINPKTGALLAKTINWKDLERLTKKHRGSRSVIGLEDLKSLTLKSLARLYTELNDNIPQTFETKAEGLTCITKFLNPLMQKEIDMKTSTKAATKKTASKKKAVSKKKVVAKKVTAKKAAPASKKKAVSKKVAAKRAGGTSKFELLRNMFAKKGARHTLDTIQTKTGFDRRNAMTAIGILKNKERTASPILIVRDAEKGDYVRK